MPLSNDGTLTKCEMSTNCLLVEWRVKDVNEAYKILINAASDIPRTKVIQHNQNYWHGVCRSLIFRFPDDLEINKITSQGIIQIKSSSRFGMSDLGVNAKRINQLYRSITELIL